MPTVEDVFSDTFARFLENWTFITSLRQFAEIAIPSTQEALRSVHTDYIERVAVDPDYKKLIVKFDGSEATWDDDIKNMLQTGMTETVIANTRAGIDAASLVFAHSALDDCAWSFLRVCALASPTDWDPVIREKKVNYDLVGKAPEAIREILILEKLEQLERESLLKKVDLLFRLCTPPKDFAPIKNYSYDRDRLEIIDSTRHGIIHREGLGKSVPNIVDVLDFIANVANYLLALVNNKYGVQLNILKLFNLPIPPLSP
jgi:hypothetical protein